MSKITYTTETLYHFNCGACGGWWSVGDAPIEGETWFCTWCGFKATIEPALSPKQLKARKPAPASESEKVEVQLRGLGKLGAAMADVLEMIRLKHGHDAT